MNRLNAFTSARAMRLAALSAMAISLGCFGDDITPDRRALIEQASAKLHDCLNTGNYNCILGISSKRFSETINKGRFNLSVFLSIYQTQFGTCSDKVDSPEYYNKPDHSISMVIILNCDSMNHTENTRWVFQGNSALLDSYEVQYPFNPFSPPDLWRRRSEVWPNSAL